MRHGVPALAGKTCARTMITRLSSTLVNAEVPPAKAGTPNLSTSLGKLEAEIQQGMNELEGMLK